jgi:hypothetical protein
MDLCSTEAGRFFLIETWVLCEKDTQTVKKKKKKKMMMMMMMLQKRLVLFESVKKEQEEEEEEFDYSKLALSELLSQNTPM